MRKLIITAGVVAALVGGYIGLSKLRAPIGLLQGETAKVHRGDLVVPINASGNIKPASVTQLKSKASGEVIELPFEVGAMVKQGDLVVRLLDVDERVNVDRANSEFEQAQIRLENTRIAREKTEKVGVLTAEANLQKAQAAVELAKLTKKFKDDLKARDESQVRPLEFQEVVSKVMETEAMVKAATAEVENAKLAVKIAEKDIKTAESVAKAAQRSLDDAQQRLKETKIYSPIDGMILARNVQLGEVIQGGRTTITGGTVLIEIAKVAQIYAVVNVDEADIGQVRQLAPESARPGPTATQPSTQQVAAALDAGQPVEVKVETFKEDRFEGMIERIAPQSELIQNIATFKVWIRLTSANRDKLVGLLNTQAEAHFTARSVRDALLVNYDAFQKNPNGEGFGVYVPVRVPGKEKLEPKFKPCRFGADNGIDVEVQEGLKEGEIVYTKLPQKTQKEQEAEEKAGSK